MVSEDEPGEDRSYVGWITRTGVEHHAGREGWKVFCVSEWKYRSENGRFYSSFINELINECLKTIIIQ